MSDLDGLGELAENATPGPWESDGIGNVWGDDTTWVASTGDVRGVSEANAAYIAAFNPEVGKELVDVAKVARNFVMEEDLDKPGVRGDLARALARLSVAASPATPKETGRE